MSRIVRPREVENRVSICDRHLRDLEKLGKFPKRFQIHGEGHRAVGWFEDEIDAWIEQKRKEVRG
jgi:prophage regulatory protein